MIHISSCANRQDLMPEEKMSLLISGTLSIDGERVTVTYDEINEDGNEHVEMLISENTISVNRIGAFSSQMVCAMGVRSEGEFRTPFGSLLLGVFCNRLSYDINEDGGKISLSYQLDINNHFAAIHSIEMEITRKNATVS